MELNLNSKEAKHSNHNNAVWKVFFCINFFLNLSHVMRKTSRDVLAQGIKPFDSEKLKQN